MEGRSSQPLDVSGYPVSLTVSMADGLTIPMGLAWTLYGDNWTVLDSGPVTAGGTSFAATTTALIPDGSWSLYISGGGYSVGQVIRVQGAHAHHDFVLARAMVQATFNVATSDGGDLPAGTDWVIRNGNNVVLLGGHLTAAAPSGTAIGPEDIERGVHTLEVTAPGYAPFTTTIDLTDPWQTTFAFNVALQVVSSEVTFTVSMERDQRIPNGLTWSLFPSGSWDAIASGPVAAGGTSFGGNAGTVPYGLYQLWITGNGYSSGQVLNVSGPATHHDVVLEYLAALFTISISTEDGRALPAGTVVRIEDSVGVFANDTTNQAYPSPFLAESDVYVPFDVYTVTIEAPGYAPATLQMPLTNPDVREYAFSIELERVVQTMSFTVTMADDGPLPYGLSWSLAPEVSGSVPGGATDFAHTVEQSIEPGSYTLWVTGNGYSYGQVIAVEAGADVHHDVVLDRKFGTLIVTMTTDDGGDIPAGTAWQLVDEGGDVVQGGVIDTPLPNGSPLPLENPIELGVYTLKMGPIAPAGMSTSALPREIRPFTTTISVNNPWSTEYTATAALQIASTESTVTFSVSMSDDGPLPSGLAWTLYPGGSWDAIATGPVTGGEPLFDGEIEELVPFGVYQLWITGSGYSSGQVLNITDEFTHHDFVLDRLIGTVVVTIMTTDGRNLPAGTTFVLTDSAGNVESGFEATEAVNTPFTLGEGNELEFDVYTLTIEADGFYPATLEMPITNPWVTEYAFTVNVDPILSTVTFTVSMSDGGALPNGLKWGLFPDGSWDEIESGSVPAGDTTFDGEVSEPVELGVYSLWITGHGYSSGQVLNITGPVTHHGFVLDRLFGTVEVTLDTSDNGDVPAGTAWTITDSAGTVLQEGTLDEAIADGGTLPLTNPFEFDVYTLTVDAGGYHPVTLEMAVTSPWETEYAFTANLVTDREPEPSPSPTPTTTPEPTGTPTTTPTPSPTAGAEVITRLPSTGQGGNAGIQAVTLLLAAASALLLAASGVRVIGNRRQ